MVNVTWSDGAIQDLDSIARYRAQDSPETAQKFVRTIFRKVDMLLNLPRSGRIVPEKQADCFRELIYKKYLVIYEIKETEDVEILTVVHGSRILRF